MTHPCIHVCAVHGTSATLLADLDQFRPLLFRPQWFSSVSVLANAPELPLGGAVLLTMLEAQSLGTELERLALQMPVVLLAANHQPECELTQAFAPWFMLGVQDIVAPEDCPHGGLARRLQLAHERHSVTCAMRRIYATDVATGLPHEQQLIEHMSHLIALREREPAAMAVLVFRMDGFESAQWRAGLNAVAVLRRKVAVRLRAGVRASDVVASLEGPFFAVLLASVASPDQATKVGHKLLLSLHAPFRVGTQDLTLSTALGIGQYPQEGTQPTVLLRRAISMASQAPAQGRVGFANFVEGADSQAANED